MDEINRTLGEILGEMKGINKNVEEHTTAIKILFKNDQAQQSYIDQAKGAVKVWGVVSGVATSVFLWFINWRFNVK